MEKTMKKMSAVVCVVLAGSLGFSTLASAQEWGHRGGERGPPAHERFEHRGWETPHHVAPRYDAPRYRY
jgi:hypothetical protein